MIDNVYTNQRYGLLSQQKENINVRIANYVDILSIKLYYFSI